MTPTQLDAEVLTNERIGDYHQMSFSVPPEVAAQVRPGHFTAIAVGGSESSMLLRRSFSIYRADPHAGTLEIVVAVHGRGTGWLVNVARGDNINLIAPLGKPFLLPTSPVPCVLVAGGYGSAPLFALSQELRRRGCRVDLVLGAATESRLFGVVEGRRVSDTLTVATDDGSAGVKGTVIPPLEEILQQHNAAVVYACGPMGMLAAVSRVAQASGAYSQCAVEEAMACGVGVCMSCVLPVRGNDGVTRMVRSCVDGPVFFGTSVRWSDVGTVPEDVWGAPQVGGH